MTLWHAWEAPGCMHILCVCVYTHVCMNNCMYSHVFVKKVCGDVCVCVLVCAWVCVCATWWKSESAPGCWCCEAENSLSPSSDATCHNHVNAKQYQCFFSVSWAEVIWPLEHSCVTLHLQTMCACVCAYIRMPQYFVIMYIYQSEGWGLTLTLTLLIICWHDPVDFQQTDWFWVVDSQLRRCWHNLQIVEYWLITCCKKHIDSQQTLFVKSLDQHLKCIL